MHDPDGTTDARGAPARHPVRAELGLFLQLVGVCGLVFARPILDAFGLAPETFVEADAGWKAIVLFGILWVVGPPVVLWTLTFAMRVFGARVRRDTHVVVLAALAAIFTAQALFQAQDWPIAVVWVLGAVAAAAMAALWIRFGPWRELLAWLSGAPVVFLAMFLVTSPTSDLLQSDSAYVLAAGPHPPIVMVVLDELATVSLLDGTGHIDPKVFPGFARLAADSTWYRNHTTTASTTDQAVPALMTGRYPAVNSVAVSSQYPQNAFSWLGGDTAMHVAETLTQLCPASVCTGAPRGGIRDVVDRSLDLWNGRFHHLQPGGGMIFDPIAGGESRGPDFEAWIRGITKTPTSRFDFAHVVLPHVPWQLTPTGRTYDPGTDVDGSPYFYEWASDEGGRFNRERHLIQLQYTDRLIQQLLHRLDDLGTYDDSLVVVTADHGVSFSGGEPVRAPTRANLTQIAWSPLFVKAPHQRAGRVDDRNAENIDVLPTVADLIGAHLPWKVDGRSLAGPPRRSSTKYLIPPASQNQLPLDRRGRIRVDGRAGFRRVLGFPPATTGDDAFAFFRGGPAGDVVGKPEGEVPSGAPSDAHATLDPPRLDVEAGKGPIPIVVRATLDGAAPDTVVALIVNETIVGTYRPTTDHKARFVVPEAVMHAGQNDVALVTVTGPRGDEKLHRLDTGQTVGVHLRAATPADVAVLEHWDRQPHVIAASGDDDAIDWVDELAREGDAQQTLVAELDGRPIGVVQIIDPAREETHYWGDIEPNLRAIDIWIGEAADLGHGHGTAMMTEALDRCFAAPEVTAVVIDPLARNTAAHRFYRRLGFVPVGRRTFGTDDCLVHRLERTAWVRE